MFRRRRKRAVEEPSKLDLPPLEELEQWVITLVIKLELKPGNFTFLACYGGVLLYIRNEGLSWIPYKDINEAIGRIDKNKLVENTAMLGGAAAAVAAHTMPLPAILLPKFIKGSYRVIANPAPKNTLSFLQSVIDRVVVHERKIKKTLLDTFEEVPYKEKKSESVTTHTLAIYRKFLDATSKPKMLKMLQKGITTFFSGSSQALFPIPPEADVRKFCQILEENGITVEWTSGSTQPNISTDE